MVRLQEGNELADSRVVSVAPRVSGIFADVAITLPEPPPRGLAQQSATGSGINALPVQVGAQAFQ